MTQTLRILSLEDDPKDADLIQALLEEGGLSCAVRRVDTKTEFAAAIEKCDFDLILADYTLPAFDGLSALKLALEKCPDVPFIFVSGTLGEEVAIGALNMGATDYVLKTRLGRIVPSVERALREARDRIQLKCSQEALRRSEVYSAEAQKLSHTGSFGWNVSTGEIYWSEETYNIFGFEQAVKPTLELALDRIHPDDRENVRKIIGRASENNENLDFEQRLLMPDGSVKHLQILGRSSLAAPGQLEFMGAVTDITASKVAAEQLRRSEADLLEAQRLSQTGSWKHDLVSGIATVSPEVHRIFGIRPEEDASTADFFFGRIHEEDRPNEAQNYERACLAKTDFESEYRIVLPDGSVKYVRNVGHPVLNESGDIREFVGTVIDITEQRHAEAVIRQKEAELREVLDTIPALVWSALPDGSNAYVSKRFAEYMGSLPGQASGSGWQALVHSDDLERHVGKWMEAVATGKPHESEVRCRRSDGQYRWQLDRGVPLRDEDGSIIKWYGVTTDIEDRKQAEDKIREQEAEFRQIVDLVPQLVAVYGPNRERLYANRTALDYLGIGLDEWRRETFAHSTHPDDAEHLKTSANRAFSSGSAYDVEVRLRKHDGSYRWFLARYNPVRDDKGHITRWYVTATDIEDRKQAEDRLRSENVALREEIDKASMFEEIVGASPVLQALLSRVSKVAPSDSTVLITGETGTGKELVARAIHRRSKRASRAFVSVNCAAIPRDLIASELFGHEKGAFTGAFQQRLGRFELANGGTLFLDEVGELPAQTQIALLRVLQEHEFERVGGSRPIRADVRVIAATNRDLQAAIGAGAFRSDLFYRLNVFPIEIPPLRERKDDIRLLVEYFIDRYARKARKRITTVDKKTLGLLESYAWPGNVRELQNVIERSVIVCETENFSVDESWLPQQPCNGTRESQVYLSEKVAAQEREMIEAALRESQGRVFGPSGAAAKLGIARSTLESKIRSLKIEKQRFKASDSV